MYDSLYVYKIPSPDWAVSQTPIRSDPRVRGLSEGKEV